MYLDGYLQFSNAQALTTTAASTNVIDMSVARDMGIGYPLPIAVQVVTALVGGTSVQVQLQYSADNATWTTLSESRAYLTAELVAGAKLFPGSIPARPSNDAMPRYYRLNYVIAGTYTSGAVTAYIVLDRQDQVSYPAGINVFN